MAKDGQVIISGRVSKSLSPALDNVKLTPLKDKLEVIRDGVIDVERLFEVIGIIIVHLTDAERNALMQQNPATKSLEGFQAFLVNLQKKVEPKGNRLVLTMRDRDRIARYAHDYRGGGWQARLKKIFGRALGANLGRDLNVS